MSDWSRYLILPPPLPLPIKRKVFVSYCHLNLMEARTFVSTWRNVFIARALGMAYSRTTLANNIVNSVAFYPANLNHSTVVK
jgi:ABC-type transport system substrate-binding protein